MHHPSQHARQCQKHHGFTLIELLIALSVMALMAVLSWRGLDGMARAQTQTQQRANEVLSLQTALAQWGADLDAMVQGPGLNAVDWDGRGLRITRQVSSAQADGLVVVAWARRDIGGTGGTGQWLRWQSLPLRDSRALQAAWEQAALWAQNPGDEAKKREVFIAPLAQWQIYFYRGDAWSNPLSSDGRLATQANSPLTPALIPSFATAPPGTVPSTPDGIRLVLTLPPGHALHGPLTRDWVRPTLGGGKS
jgi:general secretion pathway protein J